MSRVTVKSNAHLTRFLCLPEELSGQCIQLGTFFLPHQLVHTTVSSLLLYECISLSGICHFFICRGIPMLFFLHTATREANLATRIRYTFSSSTTLRAEVSYTNNSDANNERWRVWKMNAFIVLELKFCASVLSSPHIEIFIGKKLAPDRSYLI